MHPAKMVRTKGFTLMEILVVMCILSVLTGILFPVFARVREKGRSVVCQSNLHQMALAMQQYVQDSDGRYPHYTPAPAANSEWSHKILPYLKDVKVFACPTISEPPEAGVDPLNITVYLYDSPRLNHLVHTPEADFVGSSESVPDLSSYASTICLNACYPRPKYQEDQYTEYMRTACGRVVEFANSPRHHSGGTNWSFLDGHVKWMTPEQFAELSCAHPPMDTGGAFTRPW